MKTRFNFTKQINFGQATNNLKEQWMQHRDWPPPKNYNCRRFPMGTRRWRRATSVPPHPERVLKNNPLKSSIWTTEFNKNPVHNFSSTSIHAESFNQVQQTTCLKQNKK